MSELLIQHPLGPTVPPGWETPFGISVELTWDTDNGTLFKYKIIKAHPFVIIPTKDLDLTLAPPCWVVIRLDQVGKNWTWSRERDAVTTATPLDKVYFALQYLTAAGDWVARSSFPSTDRMEVVRFGAALNPTAASHKFSYNLDLVYPDGKTLAITIDPDIRNPGQP